MKIALYFCIQIRLMIHLYSLIKSVHRDEQLNSSYTGKAIERLSGQLEIQGFEHLPKKKVQI